MNDSSVMQLLDNLKLSLEELYQLYNGDIDGEMVMIDELDCSIYKGKKLHQDQNVIMYNSEQGTIKIDGVNGIIKKSFVKINGKDEVMFDMLNEQSEEFQFVKNVIYKICNKLNSERKTR